MYATDLQSRVSEYSLSSPWNISTASYLRNFIALQTTYPLGMFMRPDGTEMYLASGADDQIAQYSLSTPWNISTASHTRNLSVSATDAGAQSVFFVASGDIMYLLGSENDKVYRFNLSNPWDISTASFVNDFSVFNENPATLMTTPDGLFFSPDGLRFFVVVSFGDEVNEYSMSNAWDISTASYVRVVSISAQDRNPRSMFIGNDGMAMYVIGRVGREVNEYSLG